MNVRCIVAAAAFAVASVSSDALAAIVDLTTGSGPGATHVLGSKSDLLGSEYSFRVGRIVSRNGAPATFRMFFTFDLSEITATVVGAELRMFNGTVSSPNATETVTLYDVSTQASDLLSSSVTPEIYADLGTGTQYGTNSEFTVGADATTVRPFILNAAAIAAINSSLGSKFSMGGSMGSIDPSTLVNQLAFGASSASESATLRLTIVPEPVCASLGLSALVAVVMLRRRLD